MSLDRVFVFLPFLQPRHQRSGMKSGTGSQLKTFAETSANPHMWVLNVDSQSFSDIFELTSSATFHPRTLMFQHVRRGEKATPYTCDCGGYHPRQPPVDQRRGNPFATARTPARFFFSSASYFSGGALRPGGRIFSLPELERKSFLGVDNQSRQDRGTMNAW